MTLQKSIVVLLLTAVLIFVAITWQESRYDRARLESTIAAQQQIINAADSREKDRDATLKTALAQIAATKRSTQTPEQILRALPQFLHLPDPITLSQQSSFTIKPGKGSAPFENEPHFPGEKSTSLSAFNSATPNAVSPNSATSPAKIKNSASQIVAASAPDLAPASDLKSEILSLLPLERSSATVPKTSDSSSPAPATTNPSQAPPGQSATIPASDLKPLFDYIQDCRACQAQLKAAQSDLTDEKASNNALTRERDAAVSASKGGTLWHRLKHNAKWLAAGAALTAALTHLHRQPRPQSFRLTSGNSYYESLGVGGDHSG